MSLHRLLSLVLALAITAATGLWLLVSADGGLPRRHVMETGVPLYEVHPTGLAPGERRPGVVIAHGFAGSARLMAPFGDTLAARGYVVVLLDFSGHGASPARLPDAAAATDDSVTALNGDLDTALTHLRSLRDVDPTRTALVGHSMGATAVTRYAAAHPDIVATVAISLPDAAPAQNGSPANLLVMPGALEFPAFHEQAELAVAGAPDRKIVTVPGVEHVTVLYAPRTHRETADWLDSAFDRPPGTDPGLSPLRRITGAALLVVALLVGLIPLARVLLGRAAHPSALRFDWPLIGRAALVAAAASAVAAPTAAVLPTTRLPLSLAGYLAVFATVTGATILAYTRWRVPAATEPNPRPRWRLAVAAPVLIAYAAVTIAVPLHLGLTHAAPTGPRWWMLALVCAGFAFLAYAADRLTTRDSIAALVVSAVATVALTWAALAGLTSSFLILAVPMIAVLFLWQSLWSAVLNRHHAPRWMVAPVGAILVAWPLTTTLPVIA